MTGHPNLLDAGLSAAWVLVGVLVGIEWLARQTARQQPTQREILVSFLLGAVWPLTVATALAIWWYQWRCRRLSTGSTR